jgi:hypothetical protein
LPTLSAPALPLRVSPLSVAGCKADDQKNKEQKKNLVQSKNCFAEFRWLTICLALIKQAIELRHRRIFFLLLFPCSRPFSSGQRKGAQDQQAHEDTS